MILHPLVDIILTDQIRFSYFVWGHLVIIYAKLCVILTIDFIEDFLNFLYRYLRETYHTPWSSCFLVDQI